MWGPHPTVLGPRLQSPCPHDLFCVGCGGQGLVCGPCGTWAPGSHRARHRTQGMRGTGPGPCPCQSCRLGLRGAASRVLAGVRELFSCAQKCEGRRGGSEPSASLWGASSLCACVCVPACACLCVHVSVCASSCSYAHMCLHLRVCPCECTHVHVGAGRGKALCNRPYPCSWTKGLECAPRKGRRQLWFMCVSSVHPALSRGFRWGPPQRHPDRGAGEGWRADGTGTSSEVGCVDGSSFDSWGGQGNAALPSGSPLDAGAWSHLKHGPGGVYPLTVLAEEKGLLQKRASVGPGGAPGAKPATQASEIGVHSARAPTMVSPPKASSFASGCFSVIAIIN